jgi:Aspartyl protease
MKYQILLIISLFITNFCTAQNFSFNQGGTNQKGYFSVIKFENYRGFIIVTAKIKGNDYKFLLDTGAPNAVSKSLQAKLNLNVLTKIPIGDSNGTTDSMPVLAMDELVFGGIAFKNIPTLILDSPLFVDCMKVDGVIGSNMLRNSIARLSYVDSTITLTDDIKKLNLSKKYASKMRLNSVQSTPQINVELIGKKWMKEQLIFDTGMNGFYVLADSHYEVAKKYALFNVEAVSYGRSSNGIHGNGKDMPLKRLQLPRMSINGVSFQNISTRTTTDTDSKIGHDILKYGNVTLDFKNRNFYFEPFKEKVDLSEKKFPISLRFNDNKSFMGVIWDEKLRENVQIGDQIVAIDDVNCEHITICEGLTTKSFQEKESVKLTIKDKNGLIKDVIIQKK